MPRIFTPFGQRNWWQHTTLRRRLIGSPRPSGYMHPRAIPPPPSDPVPLSMRRVATPSGSMITCAASLCLERLGGVDTNLEDLELAYILEIEEALEK